MQGPRLPSEGVIAIVRIALLQGTLRRQWALQRYCRLSFRRLLLRGLRRFAGAAPMMRFDRPIRGALFVLAPIVIRDYIVARIIPFDGKGKLVLYRSVENAVN